MKNLYKFHWDCGRQGCLDGLFVSTQEEVDDLIGTEIYFGEVLGKQSEVSGEMEVGDITKVNIDSETVEKMIPLLGVTWSGFNPFNYLEEEYEDEDDD